MKVATIGQIGRPHGLNGCVAVHPMTYDANRFDELTYVYLDDEFLTKLKIETIEVLTKSLRVKFVGVDSREAAEKLRNQELVIDENEMIHLPENVYFHHELIGCEVFNKAGERIGSVSSVMESTANDIYVVKTVMETEVLIPAISQFVKKTDIQLKRIDIEEIPGLIS
jgi:16S rRNA processing protein RimM